MEGIYFRCAIITTLFVFFRINKLLLLILVASLPVFAGGPTPDSHFYRADTRTPEQIFGTKENPGPGFQTWATTRGVPENTSVLDYLSGLSVRPAPVESRNAGWVSVSGFYGSVIHFLDMEIAGPSGLWNPPEVQYIYFIAPTSDAYNVNWMLNDYASRTGMTPQLRELMEFSEQDEWIVRGGINTHNIMGVERYRYDRQHNYYVQDGEFIENPNYVAQPLPEAQTINPIDGDIPETLYGYTASGGSVAGNASVAGFEPYSSSCASMGASFSLDIDMTPPATGCDYSEKAIEQVVVGGMQKSLLVLSDGYCLRPALALTQSKMSQRSYLYLDSCDDRNVAYYDLARRIVFPINENGLEVCMTAPEQVIDGKTEWDYVQFWPCDINNTYQQWYIRDGKIFSHLQPKIYIKIKGWYGVMSKNNNYGNNYLLDEKKMSEKFFSQPSSIFSVKREIGINWFDGGYQYPMSHGMSSESYLQRTYYDLETKQISILVDEFQPVYHSGRQFLMCLTSQQGKSPSWQWASWNVCDANDNNQKWNIELQASNPVEKIHFKDVNDAYLYFNLKRTVNYGYPYTKPGKPTYGSWLDITRSYGICTNLRGWKQCYATKHSEKENDGELYSILNSDFNYLSPNGKPTQVQMLNKGAYIATLTVKYKELIDGSWKSRTKVSSAASGRTASVYIPTNAIDVSASGTLKTGLIWKPIRQIFYMNLCRFNNRWYSDVKGVNIIKARVWGTTFHSAWRLERTNGTIDTETDTSKSCNW